MWEKFRIDKKMEIDRKYVKIGIVVLVVGIFLFAAYEVISRSGIYITVTKDFFLGFLRIIRPIIVAAVFTYLLFPPVCYIERILMSIFQKKGVDKYRWAYRMASITIVFIIIIFSVVIIFNYIIPPLLDNARSLIENIPQYEKVVRDGLVTLSSYFESLNLDYQKITSYLDKITAIFATFGERIVYVITNSISGVSSFLVDFVLTVIFCFYFLKDKEMLFDTVNKFGKAFIPNRIGKALKRFIFDLDEVVGCFVRGVLLDALIVGIVSSILMLIIKHPFAILVGIIAGICNVLPYIGPAIGAATAFILGMFSSITVGVWGGVLLLLYQQIDGNIIQPKIVGGSVGVPPVFVLVAITIGAGYFGIIGILLAVPTAAMIKLYIHRAYKRKGIE
ncbi:MAG: AI-2E family transporter [Clostridium sp.]|nr:AI-2E family transporter [Clostridium sp.]MDU7082194.1 AI-2E family transporter [Clostridium sp.]